ncbi:uncharacterized protein LOC133191311 [Saccostrea echinata]|uniref:uncharacterized protein LOC133191311 n=1 Tax=Saccostrea echinata TaxID=191078 RepID=UPI002A832D7A|nr:uncharacterized protein LOC133191311 [Saccostrea echinata]
MVDGVPGKAGRPEVLVVIVTVVHGPPVLLLGNGPAPTRVVRMEETIVPALIQNLELVVPMDVESMVDGGHGEPGAALEVNVHLHQHQHPDPDHVTILPPFTTQTTVQDQARTPLIVGLSDAMLCVM